MRTAAAPPSNRVVSTWAEPEAARREPDRPQQAWPSTCRSCPSSPRSRSSIAQVGFRRRGRGQPDLGQAPSSDAASAELPGLQHREPAGMPAEMLTSSLARSAIGQASTAGGRDFRDRALFGLASETVWTIGGPATGIASRIIADRSRRLNVHRPRPLGAGEWRIARAARQWTRCEERRLERTGGSASRMVTRRGWHVG